MTISEIGMAIIARLRIRRTRRSSSIVRPLTAATAFALAAMVAVGGAAFARPVGTTGVPVSGTERTEGEKFANDYGYANLDRDASTGRTPRELATQEALAWLQHRHEVAVANQRTEGDKFANNYGYGSRIDRLAAVERTEGEKFANNYGYGSPIGRLAAVELAEGERFAHHHRFGPDAHRTSVASVSRQSPAVLSDSGTSWESMTITASLIVLLMGTAFVILRRRPSSAV